MSLIVEDGTGLATAQSYVSVADCTAYHAARGNAAWAAAATDALREQALTRAASALDGIYSSRWPGYLCNSDQALDWPRYDAIDARGYEIDSGSVPLAVKNACCEAALVEIATPGALSKALEHGGAVKVDKTGPITTEYFPGASAGTVYLAIQQAIARIVPNGGSRMRRN